MNLYVPATPMKESYSSHVSCLKKLYFGLKPESMRLYWQFLLGFIQVFSSLESIVYKPQYYSIHTSTKLI
jgi:hypothetical protein